MGKKWIERWPWELYISILKEFLDDSDPSEDLEDALSPLDEIALLLSPVTRPEKLDQTDYAEVGTALSDELTEILASSFKLRRRLSEFMKKLRLFAKKAEDDVTNGLL